MARALVLGGSGMMRATVEALATAGHGVTVTCRDPRGVPTDWSGRGIRVVTSDRDDAEATGRLAGQADMVVDALCHGPVEARQLVVWSRHATVVMVSSAAVYVDEHGNHQNSDERARWAGPIREDQPTMPFSDQPWNSRLGYGANKAEAERILLDGADGVLVLRPAKIHGPGMRNAREWSVVGPVRAGRSLRVRDLAAREPTTAADDLAEAVVRHVAAPASRVLNIADADTPTPLERARTLAALVDPDARVEAVSAEDPTGDLLPWPAERVLDTAAARAFGIEARPYATAVRPAVDWLLGDEGTARMLP